MQERTIHTAPRLVNTLVTMPRKRLPNTPEARGARLQAYFIERWLAVDGRRGMLGLAAEAGVNRDTLYGWFGGGEPSLSALQSLATALQVSRAEIVAAMDGELAPPTIRSAIAAAFEQQGTELRTALAQDLSKVVLTAVAGLQPAGPVAVPPAPAPAASRRRKGAREAAGAR